MSAVNPRNFTDFFCTIAQVLCSQIDKVIVKDYNHLRQIPGTKSKEERLQFDVDYVMDDSYVPHGNRKRKEDSQRRMFETLGKPCVENGLNGYNTTVSHGLHSPNFLSECASKRRIQGHGQFLCIPSNVINVTQICFFKRLCNTM